MARIHQGTSPNVILTLNIVKGKNLVPRARRGTVHCALASYVIPAEPVPDSIREESTRPCPPYPSRRCSPPKADPAGGIGACPEPVEWGVPQILKNPPRLGDIGGSLLLWQGFQIGTEGQREIVALPAADVRGSELDVNSIRCLCKSSQAGHGPE